MQCRNVDIHLLLVKPEANRIVPSSQNRPAAYVPATTVCQLNLKHFPKTSQGYGASAFNFEFDTEFN